MFDEPDEAGGCFDPLEHRRGAGSQFNAGIFAFHCDLSGLFGGIGNATRTRDSPGLYRFRIARRQNTERSAGKETQSASLVNPVQAAGPSCPRQNLAPNPQPLAPLNLGRQIARFAGRSESVGLVATIAKRLVRGVAATAQGDDGAAAEAEFLAFGVMNAEVAFDANRSVVVDCDFRRCHALRW